MPVRLSESRQFPEELTTVIKAKVDVHGCGPRNNAKQPG